MGFDSIFRGLIQACLRSASYSVLVEGSPTEIFTGMKGIRQGDPISPLLFITVTDYLSRLVIIVVEKKQIEILKMGGISVEAHLTFADDVVFFTWASRKYLSALNNILDEFYIFSGLSKKVYDKEDMSNILGFLINSLPVIGVPMTRRAIRHKDCEYLIASLKKFLARWSKKNLSYSGRVQLMQWVLK